MGHKELWDLMQKKYALHAKEDFSEGDGNLAAKLEDNLQKWADGMPNRMPQCCLADLE